MEDTTFSRSRARAELSKLPRQPIQGTLGFDVSRSKPVPISNDPALASKVEGILNHPEVHAGGFVLVAISSSRHELYSVEWGLALPADENRLVWSDYHETLLFTRQLGPTSPSLDRSFTSDDSPRRLSDDGDDAVDTQGDR